MKITSSGNIQYGNGEHGVATAEFCEFVAEYCSSEPCVVAHTSGSTGDPKEIYLPKADMAASARATNAFFGIGSESTLYLPLSPKYIAGKMMIVRAIEAGANIYCCQPSNEILADYNGPDIDIIAIVPSQLPFLLNTPGLLDKIRCMIIGGGQLPERLERRLAERGVKAYKTYGMTETCSHVALSMVTETADNAYEALGGTTFECDGRGCLVLNTPQFSTKRFVTNDMVRLVDDKHFHWLGRIDNVINTGGLKVFPEEVEAKLAKLISHARFFVTSQPSEKWGEEIVLALEYPTLPEGKIKEGELMPAFVEEMKKILPPYAVPRRYIAVRKFAETPTGKVIRRLPV